MPRFNVTPENAMDFIYGRGGSTQWIIIRRDDNRPNVEDYFRFEIKYITSPVANTLGPLYWAVSSYGLNKHVLKRIKKDMQEIPSKIKELEERFAYRKINHGHLSHHI